MKHNPVAHFEIYADDPEKLGQFYTGLFDWSVESVPNIDYWFVKTVECDEKGKPKDAGGINGGMLKRPEGFEGKYWFNYIIVESVDATIEKAKGLGAKLMKEKSAVPGMGWYAMLIDPQENRFAIWQPDKEAK